MVSKILIQNYKEIDEESASSITSILQAIIPRANGNRGAWLRKLVRQLQRAVHYGPLPLPAARSGQPALRTPDQAAPSAAHLRQIRTGPGSTLGSLGSAVVSFLGTLVAEMLGLYLLTLVALSTVRHCERTPVLTSSN